MFGNKYLKLILLKKFNNIKRSKEFVQQIEQQQM